MTGDVDERAVNWARIQAEAQRALTGDATAVVRGWRHEGGELIVTASSAGDVIDLLWTMVDGCPFQLRVRLGDDGSLPWVAP